MPASPVLEIEHEAATATLWLNRPDARNAMGREFWSELPVAMADLAEDAGVRAVVLAARGAHFSAGLDLKEMAGMLGPREGSDSPAARAAARRATIQRMQEAVDAVARCPKPVIAAVHGHCIGAAVDLITACDIRLGSGDAVFSVRETRLGIVADLGVLQRLPGIVGSGHAAELALSAKDVGAARANEIGLVNEVFEDRETLLAAARALATQIAALPPLAVQGTKAVLAANDGRSVAQGLEYVATWNAGALESDDVREALAAFLEKRPPTFRGS